MTNRRTPDTLDTVTVPRAVDQTMRSRHAPTRRSAAVAASVTLIVSSCAGGDVATTQTPSSTSLDGNEQSRPVTTTTIVRDSETELPLDLRPLAEVWVTDFSTRSIDLDELALGIPARDPRDLIPPIDDPVFEPVAAASTWLESREPGVLVDVEGDARFYPLRILTRHEIVNDDFGDIPVAVTYCPLCNSALVFDRRVGDTTLRMGVSGLLRNSDLVMWDDQTESLWQQITGEAVVGLLTGSRLEPIGSAIVRWMDFASANPDGRVLSRDLGFGIPYSANPYVGYSSRSAPYPFFEGTIDARYPALARVVGVSLGGVDKAYPFSELAEVGAVNDEVAGVPVVVLWGAPDTADALDAGDVARGAGIGTGVAYLRTVDGQVLTFSAEGDDRFVDAETDSTWTLLGRAVEGPLSGTQLDLAVHRNEFWFAWQAFFPSADIWDR